MSPNIPEAVTASSALDDVAGGRTAAMFAEERIVVWLLISTLPVVLLFSVM